MTAVLEPMTAERRAQIVPPARHQAELPPDELLHSGNAGVVVQKVGQLRSEYRNEGRFPLIPAAVQRALIMPLAALGTRLGYRAFDARHGPRATSPP